ncbi:hypothetical protein [Methanosarcina sp. WWM596]|nr:hypothetical protein [Methanosarcina sp. WWM596]
MKKKVTTWPEAEEKPIPVPALKNPPVPELTGTGEKDSIPHSQS